MTENLVKSTQTLEDSQTASKREKVPTQKRAGRCIKSSLSHHTAPTGLAEMKKMPTSMLAREWRKIYSG